MCKLHGQHIHTPASFRPGGGLSPEEVTGLASSVRIHTTTVGYRLVVSVDGEVSAASGDTLTAALRAAVASPERELWIDLAGVTAIDPAAVTVLLAAHRELASDHRSLAVICPPGRVRAALDRADTQGRLPIFPDRASAHYYRAS
jgi:anti-anti-sigma factor